MKATLSSIVEVLLIGVAIGIAPLILGFIPAKIADHARPSWRSFSGGVALGFLTLFFTDLIEDSGGLGESLGLGIRPPQIGLILVFILGFAILTLLYRRIDQETSPMETMVASWLVAAAVGLHSMGEGVVIGYDFAGQVSVEEFSTLMQGLSFAIHKFLEGFTIAFFFPRKIDLKGAGAAALLAGLPLLAGMPVGLAAYPAILSNFLFAAGAGGAVFILIQIVSTGDIGKGRISTIIGFAVGFLLVYFAGLIHFTEFQPLE